MGNLIVEDFDNFNDTLGAIPVEEVTGLLREQIEKTKEELVKVHHDSDMLIRKRVLAHFSLLAMAESAHRESPPHNPRKEASWMQVAREELRELVDKTPDIRSDVFDTVFFDRDKDKRRRYAVSVSAAIEPYGEYDSNAFVAGVALGEVSISKRKYLPQP